MSALTMAPAVVHDELFVAPWVDDAEVERMTPRSPECEHLWLPRIGPTTYLLGCRLALAVETATLAGESYAVVNIATLATALGVGSTLGPNSPLLRSLNRLVVFGLARNAEDGWTYEVRPRWMAPRAAKRRYQ